MFKQVHKYQNYLIRCISFRRISSRNMERIEIVTVARVPIKVLCFGDVTPSEIVKNPQTKPKKLVLIIPGNPGIIDFYREFAARICEKTRLPIWVVAHGGNEDVPVPRGSLNPDLYNLKGQLLQKRELIDSYLNGVTLRCIGHSIGCKILLDLLKSDEKYSKQIERVELLFPAIERMATTPSGKTVAFLIDYFTELIIFSLAVFHPLPNWFKEIVIRILFKIFPSSPKCLKGTLRFLEPRVMRKSSLLADDEMKTVIERDDETIRKFVKILHFYYGATDGWTPLFYVDELKRDIPEVNVQVDELGIAHTFINNSKEMADLIVGWWENQLG